jgi:hypothetical protein
MAAGDTLLELCLKTRRGRAVNERSNERNEHSVQNDQEPDDLKVDVDNHGDNVMEESKVDPKYDPPGDVIMREWAAILGIGGGRGKGTAPGAASSGLDGGGGRVSKPGIQTLAPGDATCLTVHRASQHVFDYRFNG